MGINSFFFVDDDDDGVLLAITLIYFFNFLKLVILRICIVLYCIGCCPYTSFVFYRRGYRSICLESRYHFSVKVL